MSPPAAATASTTRAPASSSTSPGRDTAPSTCTSSGAPETAPSPEAVSAPASLPASPAIGPPMVPCTPPPVAVNDRIAATATAPMNSATAAPTVTRSRGEALRALGSSAPNGSGPGAAGIPARYARPGSPTGSVSEPVDRCAAATAVEDEWRPANRSAVGTQPRVAMFTRRGARTMTFTISRSPTDRDTASDARASDSSSSVEIFGETSSRSRTLPSTCTMAVTDSSTRSAGSALRHVTSAMLGS